jgi:hypothetical protein
LYRGTTLGWPGSTALQSAGITPTSSDPLVATLFAVECRNHGQAIVQICERRAVEHSITDRNVFFGLEKEVALAIKPDTFSQQFVVKYIAVQTALQILSGLGFEMPPAIYGKRGLQTLLESTPRLSDRAIREFNQIVATVE